MWRRWECFCFRTFGAAIKSSSLSWAISSFGKVNLLQPAQYDPPSLHSGRLSDKRWLIFRFLIRIKIWLSSIVASRAPNPSPDQLLCRW
jgi:hypothetical protein